MFQLPDILARFVFGIAPMLVYSCALGFGAFLTGPVFGEEAIAEREAKIKAVYLYQFIRYVTWPESAFQGEKAPLIVGAVGNDPVNPFIRRIAAQRDAGNRPLLFLPVESVEQAKRCHILFVSDSVPVDTSRVFVEAVKGRPTLVVSEFAPNILPGRVITFVIAGNNVRLQLSMKSAASRGLKVSSQLAKIATVID